MINRIISPISKPIVREKSNKGKVVFGLIILLIVGGLAYWLLNRPAHQDELQESSTSLLPSINGQMVDPNLAKQRPVAVVIENHTDSRPQSGYTNAEIVYESLAEGGITRTLAVFQTKEARSIGPIRSARPYFNFIANQWGAIYVHSGGSKQALSELTAGVHNNLYDVNEFYFGKYFNRNSSRYAPHNLYSSTEELTKLAEAEKEQNWNPVKLWNFGDIMPTEQDQKINNIIIPFSIANYEVNYKFNSEKNSYERIVGGKASIDEESNEPVLAKNVLIQFADTNLNPDDDLGTLNIKLNNSGPCILFTANLRKDCRWSFEGGKTIYKDMDGNDLKLQAGQTWVEIFPRDRQNEVTSS